MRSCVCVWFSVNCIGLRKCKFATVKNGDIDKCTSVLVLIDQEIYQAKRSTAPRGRLVKLHVIHKSFSNGKCFASENALCIENISRKKKIQRRLD